MLSYVDDCSYRMDMLYSQSHLCRGVVPMRHKSLSYISCILSAPFGPGRNLLCYYKKSSNHLNFCLKRGEPESKFH